MLNDNRDRIPERHSAGLQRWYSGPLGRLFGEAESAPVEEILPLMFGYHIVSLGTGPGRDLLAVSRIAHRCRLDSMRPAFGEVPDVLAEPEQLPIASDCIDVVMIAHLLEFVTEPERVLGEVERILIPEGHVIILGFNPVSLWGLWRLLRRGRGRAPWNGRFLSVSRVRAALAALGIETLSARYCFFRPPVDSPSLLKRLTFLERLGAKWWPFWGAGYVLLAKKRVSTLTLIKPHSRSRRSLVTQGVANRTSRNCSDEPPR